jgi:hypothetical protein
MSSGDNSGGSPFERLGQDIGRLVAEKNAAYGDSFRRSGEILAILYPHGVTPAQYRDMLGVARVVDKLFRIATRKEAFGESPWRDIAGYGIVAAAADEGAERREPDLPAWEKVKPAPRPPFAPGHPGGGVSAATVCPHVAKMTGHPCILLEGHEGSHQFQGPAAIYQEAPRP